MPRFSQNNYFDENRESLVSQNEKSGHIPVLLNEVLKFLNPQPGQKFIDATINGGGHALAIIERILPNGKLLGIEWDKELLKQLEFKVKSSKFKENLVLVNDSYVNLKRIAETSDFESIDGVLFDLGMSGWHLERAGRGFSFMRDEPLDMRYQKFPIPNSAYSAEAASAAKAGQFPNRTAGEIVNKCSYEELVKILKEYGEERFAKSIAAAIVKARKVKPVTNTFQLVEIIKNSTPFWYQRRRTHFATKTLQALRIAVNNELENLELGLKGAEGVLKRGGRLAVISFHSLEDRIVKVFFREGEKGGRLKVLTKKPVRAGLIEITANPRARSAKLRVAEKM